MRKMLAAILIGLVAAAGVVALARPRPADAAALPAYHPSRLAHVGDSEQVIVVTGRSKASSYATLRTYELRAPGQWIATFPAKAARIGSHGWVVGSRRVQNTGTTPQGTYRLTTTFGLAANPGLKLPYTRVDGNDYWVGDPRDAKTYNLFQPSASRRRTWRNTKDTAERLASFPTQYQYAAMIDFNRPTAASVTWTDRYGEWVTNKPVKTRLGTAIFLHVKGKGATAGCVSLAKADLLAVLKWLNPAKRPRIVMAPESEIGTA
jgi:L,D-peptidoglycan transpeptidase YkuD (ErfK/YbiS/YcfS/YnhG family)